MYLTHGASSKYAACDCGISWSYSLTFYDCTVSWIFVLFGALRVRAFLLFLSIVTLPRVIEMLILFDSL